MLLCSSIEDVNGQIHQMANILPFKSSKGSLSVGYRFIKASKDSSLIKRSQLTKGHEFHYWQIKNTSSKDTNRTYDFKNKFDSPWRIKSWGTKYKEEGWVNKNLHASWVHLHLPSSIEISTNLIKTIEKFSNKKLIKKYF